MTESALSLAYEHVAESYRVPRERLADIEGRIGATLSLVVAVQVAVPSFIRGANFPLDFTDARFFGATVVAALVVCLGLLVRNRGTLWVIDVGVFYDNWLHYAPDTFQRHLLRWAKEHDQINSLSVMKKARWLDWVTIGFVVQAILLGWWVCYP